MKKSLIFALCLVAGFSLIFVAGCGKKAAETAAEKAIEKSTNGQADVDLSTNSVKVNTNAGTFEVGGKIDLPSGFPSDVYVIDGTITAATTLTANEGYTISIVTDKSVSEAKDLYEAKLKADGWTITFTMNVADGASVAGEKDNRTVTVSIGKTEGQTQVVVGVANKSV